MTATQRSAPIRLLAVLTLAFSLAFPACGGDDENGDGSLEDEPFWSIASPDGLVVIDVWQGNLVGIADYLDEVCLYYRVTYGGSEVLGWSPLGIALAEWDFLTDLVLIQRMEREVEDAYRMTTGKRLSRLHRGREQTLRFARPDGREVEIVFRASDDGVAFRYRLTGEGLVEVTREYSGFMVPPGSTGILHPYDILGIYGSGNYENVPLIVPAGFPAPGSGWAYPALFEVADGSVWLMVTEADLDGNYCGTRLHGEPVGTLYRIRFPHALEGGFESPANPCATLPFYTPWRVILVGDLAAIVESTLVDDLSRPTTMEELDWIKPGPASWSWWSQDTGDEALQRQYIEFAAEMDWPYTLIDAGWPSWPDVDTVIPALAAYAGALGVTLSLWYHSLYPPMNDPDTRRAELDKLVSWGVAGIKVDFFNSDKQDRIQLYIDILADAAERGILVNVHGATIPRGWQRTYPNLMTYEAVMGAEYYKWLNLPTPRMNVINVFTRNVVGSMDYTPVTFAKALEKVGITFAHSLALSVAFESGWQHFADRADANPDEGYRAVFGAFPFVADFLTAIPSAWDETRFLGGDPRSHVVLARRKDERWYIAGICSGRLCPLDLAIPLTFLGSGLYEAERIEKGDTPDALILKTEIVTREDTLTIGLSPRDGFVARLTQVPGKSRIIFDDSM